MSNICINCIHKDVCYKYRLNYVSAREGTCTDYYERPHEICVLTVFGECSYQDTGCSDCKIKQKIYEALKNEPFLTDALNKAHAELKEADKRIEFLKQQIRLWQSTEQHASDCVDEISLEQSQGKWIPVSERLPEEGNYRDCYGLPDGCVLWQTDNGDIGFGWYYHSTECWSDLNDKLIEGGKVIAWKPLPEPYKEGDKE